MKINFSCPSCKHKVGTQPVTGNCPKCGEYNFAWNIIDKEGFVRRCNIKVYGNLAISLIFALSALTFIGVDYSSLSTPHGGKAAFLVLTQSELNAILEPYFGKYSVSVGCFIISLIFLSLSYVYYRKKNLGNYESHNPLS